MHQLRRFIQEQMDARGWERSDLVRESGLGSQQVGRYLKDDREYLDEMPKRRTIAGFAKAFRVPVADITKAAAQAYGIPVDASAGGVQQLADDELIAALAIRLRQAASQQPTVPMLDLNALEGDRTPDQVDALLAELEDGAEADKAAGMSGLASTKLWLAAHLRAAIDAAGANRSAQNPTSAPAALQQQPTRQ